MTKQPLWRQVAQHVGQEIESGRYAPGERLPTEKALAERFAVNRHTVRHAMQSLAKAGVIRIDHGRGMFVTDTVIEYLVTRRTRFADNVIGADHDPRSEPVRTEVMPAPDRVARELGIGSDDRVILIETLGMADGRPISLAAHYFAEARLEGIDVLFRDTGSITQALYQLGVTDYFRESTAITTRLPDQWEARHLCQPLGQPILVGHSLNIDVHGRVIEYAEGRYAGQRVKMVFRPR